MFFNENDLVEIRLNQHWDFVDKFIIIEAGETHTGFKKNLIFDHERFKKYSNKIIYKSFESFQKLYDSDTSILSINIHKTIKSQSYLNLNDWVRDNLQAEYLTSILKEQNPDPLDIILFSCPDEILNEEAFKKGKDIFKDNKTYDLYSNIYKRRITNSKDFAPVFGFELDMYAYKLNLFSKKTPVGCMTQFYNLNKIKHTELRYYALSTHAVIENAGWHFTFLDDTDGEKVLQKYKSWAHSRDNRGGEKYFDIKSKEEAVLSVFKDYNLLKVEISEKNYPKYLIDNLNKYSSYIY